MLTNSNINYFALLIFTIVVSVLLCGIFIANIVIYPEIKKGVVLPGVTLTSMIWLSAIALAMSIAVIIWSAIMIGMNAKNTNRAYLSRD